MRHRIVWQDQLYFPHWICGMGIGSYQYTKRTDRKRLSLQALDLDCSSSVECLSVYQAHLHRFSVLWTKVCHGLPYVTTYLDDVLIHSANEGDHEKHLREVFRRLTQAGLTLRGKKCCIGMSQVAYLGHLFSSEGMEPDPQKISAVKEWNTPTDVSSLLSFLGLACCYRRYIQGFADIAAPLHRLTSKGVAFQWDTTYQSAFEQLKVELIKTPVLALPDFSQTAAAFHLQTDASAVGIGAVLEQDG